MLNDRDWYKEHGITLHTKSTVTQINRARKEVSTDDGKTASYDRLLLATGSKPFMLPVPGANLEGVITFRDIRDVNLMIDAAGRLKNAVEVVAIAAEGMEIAAADPPPVHEFHPPLEGAARSAEKTVFVDVDNG